MNETFLLFNQGCFIVQKRQKKSKLTDQEGNNGLRVDIQMLYHSMVTFIGFGKKLNSLVHVFNTAKVDGSPLMNMSWLNVQNLQVLLCHRLATGLFHYVGHWNTFVE